MPNYEASLTSLGKINNVYIYFEILPSANNPTPVPIFLKPKGTNVKVWTNSNISVHVDDLLDFELRIHAFKGTNWDFKLTNKDNKKEIISVSGVTGQIPNDGLNISVKRGHVNPLG